MLFEKKGAGMIEAYHREPPQRNSAPLLTVYA